MRTTTEFEDLVSEELKNQSYITAEDRMVLTSDVEGWMYVLKKMKGNTEVHFTNLKMLRARQEHSLACGEITEAEFNSWLINHYNARLNASRFLKSVEFRLAEIKYEHKTKTSRNLQPQSNLESGTNIFTAAKILAE